MKTDFCLEDWTVKSQRNRIRRGEEVVHLAPKAMAVLQCLADAGGEVVSRQELFDSVWPGGEISDDALTQRIVELRKAFGDSTQHSRFIETIPKVGFRLVPPVTLPLKEKIHSPKTGLWLAFIFVTVVLVTLAMYWYLESYRGRPETITTERIPSIAVMPFVNMSDDAANEYFSEGISEELLNLLTKVPQLQVTSRSSAFSFKGKDVDIPTIARQLNVTHILEGSVRKAGNQVRITAQLIDASLDKHLWSEVYDRTLDDTFAIQYEIAAVVVKQLKITLLGAMPTVEQTNSEAYVLYLQARFLRNRYTAEALEQSVGLSQQALAIDPNYAAAWSDLSVTYRILGDYVVLPHDEAYTLGRLATKKALAINPDYAPALAGLGSMTAKYDRDLAAAARYVERALILEPVHPYVVSIASYLANRLGRMDEALAMQEYLVARDPLNARRHVNLSWTQAIVGHLDDALDSARTSLSLNPGMLNTQYLIGSLLLKKREPEAALAAMQRETGEQGRLIGLAMAHHALGQAAESDVALAELIENHEQGYAYNIAYILAFRGEADRAFAWLDKAVQYNDTALIEISTNPWFDNIRDDPRWLPFLESISMSPEQLDAIEFKVTLPE